MNLSTSYLGLPLRSPVMPGACPLTGRIDTIRELADAGAGAVVLPSLFEEQVLSAQTGPLPDERPIAPGSDAFFFTPREYLEHLYQATLAVDIPVIASLNARNLDSWIDYARQIEESGAHALELNLYFLPTDVSTAGEEVERRMIDIVEAVRATTTLPLAVKLSPFFSLFPHFADRLAHLGVQGLVLFNRLYQPDINVRQRTARPKLELSDTSELRLRLRWLAILRPHLKVSLAATGGVHSVNDLVKALLVGADAVQVVSCLLRFGTTHLQFLVRGLEEYLEKHGLTSLGAIRGALSLGHCANAEAVERADYLKTLQLWGS